MAALHPGHAWVIGDHRIGPALVGAGDAVAVGGAQLCGESFDAGFIGGFERGHGWRGRSGVR